MSLDTPAIHRRLAAVGKNSRHSGCPADIRREAYLSAVVLKVHQDRAYPGSIVASLSVPWGNSTDTIGGYHLVWPRDCVEAGLALLGRDRSMMPAPCCPT